MHDPALLSTAGIQMIPARGGLTSPSLREAGWTAPAGWSAGPGPASALGLCGPAPALTRRCSASVSHFLPWSRVVHCGAPGTAAPTRESGQAIRVKPGASLLSVFAFVNCSLFSASERVAPSPSLSPTAAAPSLDSETESAHGPSEQG